ncbi:hypothetical protein ACWEU6_26760 [Streptosporangium sandarakinum]|uniref:hypothetical protein n=1 Tax=Streptosporangium sandarakinum TaxID=1260955 RepID=UPI00369A5E60
MRRRESSGWDGREVTAVAGIPMYAGVVRALRSSALAGVIPAAGASPVTDPGVRR